MDGGDSQGAQAPNGQQRRRRRRQRPQRGSNNGGPVGGAGGGNNNRPRHEQGSRAPRIDTVSREQIFQDIEGLLRQIREQAEETARWNDDEIREFVQTVTTFTRTLEQFDGEAISPRLQGDYQRVRDKLVQALRS